MATIQATLNITSSDATSESLAISQTDAITVTNPVINTGRESVDTVAATVIVPTSKAAITYLYIKNTDGSHVVTVRTGASVDYADLSAGEWAFFPIKAAVGCEVIASGAPVIIEYGYWTQ
jgi:hypothetical protein